jgi:hypothetical protein
MLTRAEINKMAAVMGTLQGALLLAQNGPQAGD